MTDATTEVTPQEAVTTEDWERYIEIDGERLTEEELKKGYLRQKDYTRKTQELSKKEKELQQSQQWSAQQLEENPEEVLIEFIRANKEKLWFASVDEIKTIQSQVENEKQFDGLLQLNPELKKFEKAIRTLQKTEWGTFEEIILANWFLSQDKLEKAKSRSIVWDRNEKPTKSLSEMSADEREKVKSSLGMRDAASFVKKQSI